MSQNKNKCSGREAKKNEQLRDQAKKDVELCLEVEMDDEVRDIITCPEKCASTLLDVTVIKPKDLNHLYCSEKATLSGEEVRKLIASMELEKQDKQKLIDKILASDTAHVSYYRQSTDPKSSGDHTKKNFVRNMAPPKVKQGHYKKNEPKQVPRVSTTDETTSEPISNYYRMKSGRKHDPHIQQIYTTPKTYSDIKSIFTCKNKSTYEQNEKPDKPCLCRNCAIVGVLTDSQKKPFITENLFDPREILSNNKKESKDYRDYKRKKCVNFKENDHDDCQYYIKHLTIKIKQLEERLSILEEKSVPRDYFKRIITKLVAHLGKITSYAGYDTLYVRPKGKEAKEPYKNKERHIDNKYYVHPVLVDSKIGKDEAAFEGALPHRNNFHENPPPESFWKWGGEILRPGMDLKNKIVMLMEDTLHNWKKPSKMEMVDRIFNGDLPQRLPAEIPVRDTPKKNASCTYKANANNTNSESTISKRNGHKNYDKKGKFLGGKQDTLYEESVNLSYINPHSTKWHEDSQISFMLESSDIDSMKQSEERRVNENYKMEFREILSTTKEADKLKLWHNVWTQAKLNGQTKDDKVTIQIPERKNLKSNKTIEIEYTIAELEELLLGSFPSNHKQTSKRNDKK